MGRWTGIIDKIDDVLGRRKRGFVDGDVAQYPPGMDPDAYIQNPIPPRIPDESTAGGGLLSPYGEREFTKNYGDIDPEEVKRLRRLYGM